VVFNVLYSKKLDREGFELTFLKKICLKKQNSILLK
jgi:hypothetical protein